MDFSNAATAPSSCKATAIGNLPEEKALDLEGLKDITNEDMARLLEVEQRGWKAIIPQIEEHSPSSATVCLLN